MNRSLAIMANFGMKTNMETNQKIGIGLGVAVLFILVFALYFTMQEPIEKANGLKLDNCIKYANVAIPDPNATQERSEFLKNCYE